MKTFLWIGLACLGLAGCAGHMAGAEAGQGDYRFWYDDNPQSQRIDIHLRSQAKMPICVATDDWPIGGRFDANSQTARVKVGGIVHVQEGSTYESGYCPRGCGFYKLAAGEQLDGYVLYSEYRFSEAELTAGKTLLMTVHPYICPGEVTPRSASGL